MSVLLSKQKRLLDDHLEQLQKRAEQVIERCGAACRDMVDDYNSRRLRDTEESERKLCEESERKLFEAVVEQCNRQMEQRLRAMEERYKFLISE